MKKLKQWEFFVGYSLAGAALLLAIWRIGATFDLNKSEWAAWVQAVGSITAIGGAFVLGEIQARSSLANELKIRQRDLERKNKSILSIAATAREYAVAMEAMYQFGPPNLMELQFKYDSETLGHVINAIDVVPMHDLGSIEAVFALLQIKTSTVYLHKHLDKDLKAASEMNASGESCETFRDDLKITIVANCGLIQRYYQKLQDALEEQTGIL
jgi:hypothetical protein